MADCIHPRWVKVTDAFTGKDRMVKIRCGKCCNCIAAEQDAWSVRISESCRHSEDFIYTTLTFAPEYFLAPEHHLDISDCLLDDIENGFRLSESSYELLCYWSQAIAYGCLPYFPKSVLSGWIKRGRESYFRETGKRLKFKYLFTSELGEKYSRPHAHGIIIGLSPDIYRRYFAEPWARDMGFYNLQYIRRNPRYLSSCVNVAHYISKYINKGCFESPLVKDGLMSKCWRMVSNGVGLELLEDDKYKFFQSDYYKTMAERCQRIDLSFKSSKTFPTGKQRVKEVKVWTDDPSIYIDSVYANPMRFLGFSLFRLKSLCLYVDSSSYYHALPRYYRDKLLGRDPNLFKFAVQTALLQDAEQRYNQDLERLAANIERSRSCQECDTRVWGAVSTFAYNLAGYILATSRQNQALWQEQRYFTHMKNHYNRPKSYRGRDIRLLQ